MEEKLFVPLDSTTVPTIVDPYKITTWEKHANKNIEKHYLPESKKFQRNTRPIIRKKLKRTSKKLSTEVFKFCVKPSNNEFHTYGRNLNKLCKPNEKFKDCVRTLQTSAEIKRNAIVREEVIKLIEEEKSSKCFLNAAYVPNSIEKHFSLIKFNSPTFIGILKPKKSSSLNSEHDITYVPSKRILDIKGPKSKTFINEDNVSLHSVDLYKDCNNTRKLQHDLEEKFDGNLNVRLGNKNKQIDVEDENCYTLYQNNIEKNNQLDGKCFIIPPDLHVGFMPITIFGTEKLKNSFEANDTNIRTACMFIAFGYRFIIPEDDWDENTIDDIIVEASELFETSKEIEYTSPQNDFNIIPNFELKKNKSVSVEVSPHPLYEGNFNVSTEERNQGNNIFRNLSLFFSNQQAGIFIANDIKLLIWKRCESFMIFDPSGRDRITCSRNTLTGLPALIKVRHILQLVHLIANLSELNIHSYKIYSIRLIQFGGEINPEILNAERQKVKKFFNTVNKNFGILNGSFGLPLPNDDTLNPSMMIACIALIYSNINSSKFWKRRFLDELIKFGARLFSEILKEQKLYEFELKDIPNIIKMGTFKTTIKTLGYRVGGRLYECKNYRKSNLTAALETFFTAEQAGLLCLDSSVLAIWCDTKLFYVFDPFQRGNVGEYIDEDDDGTCCLHIHTNLESLCRTLHRNVTEMQTVGNFFIHAVRIEKVENFNQNSLLISENEKDLYNALGIEWPIKCGDDFYIKNPCKQLKTLKKIPSHVPLKCLSVLSVNPCQRACSEDEIYEEEKKDKAQKKKEERLKEMEMDESLDSLSSSERIPEFDAYDVVENVLESIISEFAPKISCHKTIEKGDKDLFKYHLGLLESVKRKLERGEDFENIHKDCFHSKQSRTENSITLSNEFFDTNFIKLPDENWIIRGTDPFDDELVHPSGHIFSKFSSILAATFAKKYALRTWNSQILNEIVKNAENFIAKNADISKLPQILKIEIGKDFFEISLKCLTKLRDLQDLEDFLLHYFKRNVRILIKRNILSCFIMKTTKFYYLFFGHATNIVGLPNTITSDKRFALLRFTEFKDLIDKLDANFSQELYFTISSIEIKNISDKEKEKFIKPSPSKEEKLYKKQMEKEKKAQERFKDKQKFIENQIKKLSLEKFNESKSEINQAEGQEESQQLSETENNAEKDSKSVSIIENDADEMAHQDYGSQHEEKGVNKNINGEYETENEEKQKVNVNHKKQSRKDGNPERLSGYVLTENDGLFKIQGSRALENRTSTSKLTIKPCFFAAISAILLGVEKPLYKWSFLDVDRVIVSAKELYAKLTDNQICRIREIENIHCDDYIYHILVKIFPKVQPKAKINVRQGIEQILRKRKHFFIQFTNVCYALCKETYCYHLFDPYRSFDSTNVNKNLKYEEISKHSKSKRSQSDRNTASWVLFNNLDSVIRYMAARVTAEDWQTRFILYTVDVLSYKKLKKTKIPAASYDEKSYEANETENVKWLEIEPEIVAWSRLRSVNTHKMPRGNKKLTIWKSFDIEIENELYSLWGSIHPEAIVFKENAGKQFLAVNLIACCMARLYPIKEWTPKILDCVVIHGDRYFRESISRITTKNYPIKLEDFCENFEINGISFKIQVEYLVFGTLYNLERNEFNLSRALEYFFQSYEFGILQCLDMSLAFGKSIDKEGFYMFDCESTDEPLFPEEQGAAYLLYCKNIQKLLYCMIMTLEIPLYEIEFHIHGVYVDAEVIEK